MKFIFSHLGIILIAFALSWKSCYAQQQQPLEIKENSQNVLSNDPPLNLSPEETQWLAQHPLIKIAGPKAFPPFNFYSVDGVLSGMAADYIRLVFNKLHLKLEIQDNLLWPDVLKKANDKTIDLITCAARTEDREKYLLFSDSYLSFPLVIITRTTAPFIGGLDDLHGHKVAIVDKVSVYEWLKRDGIDIDPLFVETPEEGLMAVSLGKADAHIENIAAAGYLIQKNGLTNLKIAGPTTYGNYDLFIAVRNDWPELVSLINKALASISPQQRSEIRNKWLTVRYEHGITVKEVVLWILSLSGLFATGLLVFYAWNRSLKKEIVERKKAEKALQSQKSTLDSIFRAAPTGIGLVVNRVIVQVNDKLCHITGYAHEELINQNARILYPSDEEFEFVGSEKYRQIAEKDTGTVETRWQRKDKTIIDVLLSSTPVNIEDLSQGVTFTALDITERKQSETDLLAERQYLIDIIDFLPDATFIIDTDQRVVVWNRAAEAMTGVQRDDLLGKGDYAYAVPFYGERRPILIDLLNISEKEKESSYSHVKRVADKVYAETFIQTLNDGKGAYLWGVAAPLYDRTGLRTGAVEVIKDITELKKSEKANIQLQEQLLQAQKIESIGRLAGGVAHDFNNMLGVILGHAELAQNQLDKTHPLFNNLVEIRKAAQRSVDITRQLLAFARKQTIAPKAIDLNESVDGMLTMLRRLIGEDINLAWMPGKSLGSVNMDPSQLDQILANLLVNARDAITDTGKVTIETDNVAFDEAYCSVHAGFAPGEYVMLAVSDNGCGMNAEAMDHLFEPFFTTKEMGKGTGLGLATTYGIVKQNNGFINVYSEPGQGTTFKIYLPRNGGNAAPAPKEDAVDSMTHGNEVILLVEDEPMILDMTTTMLEHHGYKVLPAATPREAVRLAEEHAGDLHLLLTDVVMPEMNGRDLARNLLSLYPNLKCLFMSGYTANVIAHQGVLDEGVHFIQKPFSMNDLAVRIREALDKEGTKRNE